MDYKVELQNNNADLQSLINKANTLPNKVNLDAEITAQDTVIAQIQSALEGKAAGGSGVKYDTCKLNVNVIGGSYLSGAEFDMAIVNGSVVECVSGIIDSDVGTYDILCNSIVKVNHIGTYFISSITVDGNYADGAYFKAPSENGAIVQVDIILS